MEFIKSLALQVLLVMMLLSSIGENNYASGASVGLYGPDRYDGLPEICLMPMDMGYCRAKVKRYYFDIGRMKCTMFYWGGCAGNLNNFKTIDDCNKFCYNAYEDNNIHHNNNNILIHHQNDKHQDNYNSNNSNNNNNNNRSLQKIPSGRGSSITKPISKLLTKPKSTFIKDTTTVNYTQPIASRRFFNEYTPSPPPPSSIEDDFLEDYDD